MIDFSSTLAANGLPTKITSSSDLDKIMNAFTAAVNSLNLWQFYVFNVDKEKASVKSALSGEVAPWTGEDIARAHVEKLANVVRASGKISGLSQLAERFGVSVDPAYAASLVKAAFVDLVDDGAIAEAWGRVVDVLNVDLYAEANGDSKAALDGIRNRVQYTRLDEHGPRMGEITATYVLSIEATGVSLI